MKKAHTEAILTVYVDDMALYTNSEELNTKFKEALRGNFKVKDCGPVHWLLANEITTGEDGEGKFVKVSQEQYVKTMLQEFRMEDAAATKQPAEPKQALSKDDCANTEEEHDYMNSVPYRSAVGSLLYAGNSTRADILNATADAAKYLKNPGKRHWKAVKNILRYLKGTPDKGIMYRQGLTNGLQLTGYADANWAGDPDKRRSTTGYVFFLAGGPVSWSSKRQPTVATCTAEAEYQALSAATREAIYLRQLMGELGYTQKPIKIYTDNQAAEKIANNPMQSSRMKHIDIAHHFVRESIETGKIQVEWISGKCNVADILTKNQELALFKESAARLVK
jgi:hypothetical protein